MEQKSTGWTGTGTEVDEKKSKLNVIYESMNVKNEKMPVRLKSWSLCIHAGLQYDSCQTVIWVVRIRPAPQIQKSL